MNISIMGCGWLGFPLAQQLLRDGCKVKGSTTSEDKIQLLQKNGVEPFRISLPSDFPACESLSFWKSECLFLNIPPGRGNENVVKSYQDKIKGIRTILESSHSTIKRVLFASSTSVYPNKSGFYTEEKAIAGNARRPSGEAILKAEKILRNSNEFETVILRFGGLYGYSRHPVNHLSGRTNISSPLSPVNLIHQDDCIRIICLLLNKNITTGTYNAVSDGHPPRKTFYQSAAKHFGLEPPQFNDESQSIERLISNEKLKNDLDFTFTYPNPMDHTA